MCIIFISNKFHKDYKLIVLSNRDEFLDRESKPLDWFEYNNVKILASKDVQSGGSQFAVGIDGRFAVLTNYREIDIFYPKSRGLLTLNYISWDGTTVDYLQMIKKDKDLYPGFNLIVGNINEIWYYSNRSFEYNDPIKLDIGLHGLSNGLLEPKWWKVKRGLNLLENINEMNYENLLSILEDQTKAPKNKIQTSPISTIINNPEENFSSIYCNHFKIKNRDGIPKLFGTLGSYIFTIDINSQASFTEKILQNNKFSTKKYEWPLPFPQKN